MAKPAKHQSLHSDDFDYAADCRALLAGEKMRWANGLLYLMVIFVVVMVVWASKANLEQVVRGTGKVIPSSSVQLIQSLEGGIIKDIKVEEGEVVEKGQLLLKIDDTVIGSAYKESMSRRDALQARMIRLMAEAEGEKAVKFPEHMVKERPDLVKSEKQLFMKRRDDLQGGLATLQRGLDLAEKEINMMKPLMESGAISEIEVLRLEREINEREGTIESRTSLYQKGALEEHDSSKAMLEALLESIKGFHDRVVRTEIRSPVRGTVNKIHINTVGRVIKAGEDIMEIVPLEDTLLIEADVKPSDIASIFPGQDAVVKITAYDFGSYGGLDGKVERIGVDTMTNERGESFYKIKVRTHESALMFEGESKPIIPGMITEVDILSGKKTVLEYLLTRFRRTQQRALKEKSRRD